jgi:Tfp pilus assembly protein PilF
VPAQEARPVQFTPAPSHPETVTESYAQRHYRRAQEYARQSKWPQVVQEMRDAIRIEADKSEYLALLGLAYLHQNMTGTAKAYLRQALKLNPHDEIANRYAARLGLTATSPPSAAQNGRSAQPTQPAQPAQPPNPARSHSASNNQNSHLNQSPPQRRGLFGWVRSIIRFFQNLFTRKHRA